MFKDNKLMLTPLKSFHQARPSFEHVDELQQRSKILTKDQIKAEQAAKTEMKRMGISSGDPN